MRPLPALIPLVVLGLSACDPLPKTVVMKGEIRDDVDLEAPPFAGATMTVLDADLKKVGNGKTNAKGVFSTEIPAGAEFHVRIEGEGHVPATFSGVSGLNERFNVDEGVLHGVTDTEWATWNERFAGCPGMGEGGAIIAEPRVRELLDSNGENPRVANAVAEVWDPRTEKVIAQGCYLNDEADAYDPDALRIGQSGVFAFYGLPEGVYVLSVGLEVLPENWTWDDSVVYISEGGVAPRFPVWVHFPL